MTQQEFKSVRMEMGYTLTADAFQNAAKALAEAVNGGKWDDYTAAQKEIWRERVRRGLSQ